MVMDGRVTLQLTDVDAKEAGKSYLLSYLKNNFSRMECTFLTTIFVSFCGLALLPFVVASRNIANVLLVPSIVLPPVHAPTVKTQETKVK
jgi:hypothetical protein